MSICSRRWHPAPAPWRSVEDVSADRAAQGDHCAGAFQLEPFALSLSKRFDKLSPNGVSSSLMPPQ
jgi:hypothetical protein